MKFAIIHSIDESVLENYGGDLGVAFEAAVEAVKTDMIIEKNRYNDSNYAPGTFEYGMQILNPSLCRQVKIEGLGTVTVYEDRFPEAAKAMQPENHPVALPEQEPVLV